jgi:hypothetical protein
MKTLKEKLTQRAEELINSKSEKEKIRGKNMLNSIKEMVCLDDQEKELIKNALEFVYYYKLENIRKNSLITTEQEREIMNDSAKKYFNLIEKI